jgi:hypothetical protein
VDLLPEFLHGGGATKDYFLRRQAFHSKRKRNFLCASQDHSIPHVETF